MKLKPYPEYKESGAPWLGKVPERWEVRKTKYLFSERVQKGFPDEPLLAATQTKGVVPKTHYETRTVTAQKDLHLLKLVKKGDFVISLRSFQGGIELAHFQGIISPAYTVMISYSMVDTGYFKHLAKSKPFIGLLKTCVTGIREGQNIDYELLRRNRLPLPHINEQTQIARLLVYKSSQISRFISAKKRMIELLKEQKQAIINDAITGKIDVRTAKPYQKYKESGVEWMGKVPEGWKVLQIRRVTSKVKTGGTPKGADNKYFTENGLNWYTPGDFDDVIYVRNSERQLSELGAQSVMLFPANSVLMVGIGATIGKTAITKQPCSCNQQINVLVPNSKIQGEFLLFCLLMMKHFITKCGKFTTLPIVNQDDTKTLRIPAPSIDVQAEILQFIAEKTTTLDLAISRAKSEISLIHEYRTRLIADVVTGKVDVRDIEVPEVTEQEHIDSESNAEEVEKITEELQETVESQI